MGNLLACCVADAAVVMLLTQEAATDPDVPHEYELDGVALVAG
jgi:hypothetical protein